MSSGASPLAGFLGFWMLISLALTLGLLGGGLYFLYCLSRTAAGLERMAGALEQWVAAQPQPQAPSLARQGFVPPAAPVVPMPNTPAASAGSGAGAGD